MTFEPFGRRIPRPVNPAPQPLLMDEVPPIGDLVAVMKDDIAQVQKWRAIFYSTNDDVFASTLATNAFITKEEIQTRRLPIAGLVVKKTVERLEIRGWGQDTDDDGQADRTSSSDGESSSTPSVPTWVTEADKQMDIKVEIANALHQDAEIAGQSFALIHPRKSESNGSNGSNGDDDQGSTVVAVRAGEMIVSYTPGKRWPIWAARFIPGSPLPTPDKTSDSEVQTVVLAAPPKDDKALQDELWIYDEEKITVWKGKGISNDDWKIDENEGYEYPENLKGYCPVVPFAVESFLNPESGLQPLVGSQQALDQLMVSDTAQIEYCGFPITYALLDKDSALENIMLLLDPNTGKNVLEKKPDAFWQIVADSVGQIEPADPMILLNRMDFYIRAGLSIGSLPQSMWRGTESDQSGETVQQERESLLSKIDNRLIRFIPSWKRTWEILAKARGLDDPQIVPQWKPPTARDLRSALELALLQIQAGVDPKDALRNILDDDVIDNINMDLVAQPGREMTFGAGNSGDGNMAGQSGQTGVKAGNMAPGRRRGRSDG